MAPAVGVKLAGVFGQVTSLNDLETWSSAPSRGKRPLHQAFTGPHSRRNCWQP